MHPKITRSGVLKLQALRTIDELSQNGASFFKIILIFLNAFKIVLEKIKTDPVI